VTLVLGFGLLWVLGLRPLARRLIRHLQQGGDDLPPNLLGSVLALVFVSAMATYQLGIFAIFGGFIMGVILHDEARFVRAWRAQISPFVLVFFLPIFFTYTGLRTDIGGLSSASLWGWCAALVALATLGKFGGAYLAARACGMSHAEGGVMGALMNTRALMELIIINVGYDLGAISHNVFTMLVLMAISAPSSPRRCCGAGCRTRATRRCRLCTCQQAHEKSSAFRLTFACVQRAQPPRRRRHASKGRRNTKPMNSRVCIHVSSRLSRR
jgi:transporter, CPA2 family (2.A.37)